MSRKLITHCDRCGVPIKPTDIGVKITQTNGYCAKHSDTFRYQIGIPHKDANIKNKSIAR